jgi:hypothetical protein
MTKLVSIVKSNKQDKKYKATFKLDNNKIKEVHFGQKGASDFTIHKDIDRKNRYLQRHKSDLDTKDPMRAGYLSYYILWNKPTIRESIKDYKNRFNL